LGRSLSLGVGRAEESGGKALSRRKQGGSGAKLPALDDVCNFSIKITHFYAYFGQYSYFKAITHQFKAFEN